MIFIINQTAKNIKSRIQYSNINLLRDVEKTSTIESRIVSQNDIDSFCYDFKKNIEKPYLLKR